jgi:hypothetical protein
VDSAPAWMADRLGRRRTGTGRQLQRAWLNNANLAGVWLAGANMYGALAFGARFPRAALDGANLTRAVLARADLRDAHLVGATCVETKFVEANLRGAVLRDADLSNANLWRACLDQTTALDGVTLGPHPHLDDLIWGGAQLTGIAWDDVTVLPAELRAQTESYTNEYTDEVLPKDALRWAQEFGYAARMYQQLADALPGQVLTEHAGRFEERASAMRNLADYWQSRA